MGRLLSALLLTLLLCAYALQDNGNQPKEDCPDRLPQHCLDLSPQNDSDDCLEKITPIEGMIGTWHLSEIISHDGDEEGEILYRSCGILHLAAVNKPAGGKKPRTEEATQDQGRWRMRYVRLMWGEEKNTLKYTMAYNNTRPEFWICSASRTWATTPLQYNPLPGVVQVVKATDQQLVLTFCHSKPDGELFTVILSRVPTMGRSTQEIRSTHNLLRQRGLPIYSIRKMCSNGTAGPAMRGALLHVLPMLTVLVVWLLRNIEIGAQI